MGRETNIGWCDSTINPTSGCDGCELWSVKSRACYAGTLHEARLAKSLPGLYDEDFLKVRLIPGRMARSASWSDLSGVPRPGKTWLDGLPRCIFVGDMGDIFSAAVPDDYLRREVFDVIASNQGSRHIYMVLTKRPDRLADLSEKWGGLPGNVVAMTTITSQRTADVRIPHLLRVRARWRAISAEPLLGPVDLSKWLVCANCADECGPHRDHPRPVALRDVIHCGNPRLDWVIVGGESGSNAHPIHPQWARSMRDSCAAAGVPYFFKQWGAYEPVTPLYGGRDEDAENGRGELDVIDYHGRLWDPRDGQPSCSRSWLVERLGKEISGRLLDGVEHNGFISFR